MIPGRYKQVGLVYFVVLDMRVIDSSMISYDYKTGVANPILQTL